MLATPLTSHVPYDLVYEPAEDSFLFLDTLSSTTEKTWLHARFCQTPTKSRPPLLVEIGPGSGVVIAFLTTHAKTIFGTHVLSLSVDVNPHAANATRTTVEKALAGQRTEHAGAAAAGNGNDNVGQSIYLSSFLGDLTTPLRPREVDILIFNPPYVPTESAPTPTSTSPRTNNATKPTFEESSKLLELSYAGGLDGMEVTNRLLRQIPEVLSQRGVAYVLFCRGNKPEEVKSGIKKWEAEEGKGWRWCAETVGTSGKTAGWEKLEIVRICREVT